MLVLSRKPQEKIQIGDNITITIIKTKGKTVRVGIEAPTDVPILRGEIVASEEAEVTSVAEKLSSGQQTSEVQFTRTPKSKVATVLPSLLGDAGPLRDMLLHRTEATI